MPQNYFSLKAISVAFIKIEKKKSNGGAEIQYSDCKAKRLCQGRESR